MEIGYLLNGQSTPGASFSDKWEHHVVAASQLSRGGCPFIWTAANPGFSLWNTPFAITSALAIHQIRPARIGIAGQAFRLMHPQALAGWVKDVKNSTGIDLEIGLVPTNGNFPREDLFGLSYAQVAGELIKEGICTFCAGGHTAQEAAEVLGCDYVYSVSQTVRHVLPYESHTARVNDVVIRAHEFDRLEWAHEINGSVYELPFKKITGKKTLHVGLMHPEAVREGVSYLNGSASEQATKINEFSMIYRPDRLCLTVFPPPIEQDVFANKTTDHFFEVVELLKRVL